MRDERGQASLLMTALIGLAFVMALGTAAVGAVAVDAARAQTAADAAALAGAASADDRVTDEAARRNGGRVESIQRPGVVVAVVVRIGRVERAARAVLMVVPN